MRTHQYIDVLNGVRLMTGWLCRVAHAVNLVRIARRPIVAVIGPGLFRAQALATPTKSK